MHPTLHQRLQGPQGALLCLLAGLIYPLAFAPFSLWPLAFISPMLLLAALVASPSPRHSALRGWLFGLGVFGFGTSWVWISMTRYGGTPPALATLLTALFSMAMALFFALSTWLFHRLRGQRLLYLSFPAIWVGQEVLRSYLFGGFPWLLSGYALLDTWWQGWAPVVGIYGLGLITSLAAVTLYYWARAPRQQLSSLLWLLPLALSGLALQQVSWTNPSSKHPLPVRLVQGNVDQQIKWNEEQLLPTLEHYEQLTRQNWQQPRLVVWPETAVPALLNSIYPRLEPFAGQLYQRHSALITGVPTRSETEGERRFHNSLVVLGEGLGLYHKRHLVPFGEYVPLEQWLRGVIAFFDLPMSAFSAGAPQQPPLEAMGYQIGASICYEVAYPRLMRQSALSADLLLTVSNDTWFGDSLARYQHLQIARMRALESGRPLIRATNDGLTAVIDHQGQIGAQLAPFSPGILDAVIEPRAGLTPYIRWGDWPIWALATLLLLLSRWPRRPHP